MDKDELYQTLLDGLARYLDEPLIDDVLRAVSRDPLPGLAHSLNKNQVASKRWLMTELYRATAGQIGTMYVLGGWYGTLSNMLLNDDRFRIDLALSIDIDARCEAVARTLNQRFLDSGRFRAVTADANRIDYRLTRFQTRGPNNRNEIVTSQPDLVVNTSCEHLEDFADWYVQIPANTLQVLQSNDNFECSEHVNCVEDVEAFQAQAPMNRLLYAGKLELKRYSRFMLIGRK